MQRLVPVASGPLDARAPVVGSKSETNRSLILAGLAAGTSRLSGVLRSEDTDACVEALRTLGVRIDRAASDDVVVQGTGGAFPNHDVTVWCGDAGTCARFLPPAAALGSGAITFDGTEQLRRRPLAATLDALRTLGAGIAPEVRGLPFTMRAAGLAGGRIEIPSAQSSQPLSGVLMAAPGARARVEVHAPGLVSRAYVAMTIDLMAQFGATVDVRSDDVFVVDPQRYRATELAIEADASAASYFFAAAAVCGGSVTVPNLTRRSRQSDVGFVDVLASMGCAVEEVAGGLRVTRDFSAELQGIDVDMNEMSDTFMTLACVAPFAAAPVTIRNVAHVRVKESDRIHAVVTNLRALGVQVDERDDGVTVYPGVPRAGTVDAFGDHRIAMSFSVLGLRTEGVVIDGAECVAKTVPDFFDRWEQLLR